MSDPVHSPRVLLVEDDPTQQQIYRAWIEAADAECHAVGTLAEALRDLEWPDIVLLDMVLPDVPMDDPLRALRAIRIERLDLPIYVLTSSDDWEEEALAAGAYDYVLKPRLTAEALGRIVQRAHIAVTHERHLRILGMVTAKVEDMLCMLRSRGGVHAGSL